MWTNFRPAWVPIDVQLVAMGYLRSPDGRLRHIPGLDVVARDTLAAGIRVSWGQPPLRRRGIALFWTRRIVLSPALFTCPGWYVKDAWSHELAHLMVGRSEERARSFQQRVYGELVMVPSWAA